MAKREYWDAVGKASYDEFLKDHAGEVPIWDDLKDEHKEAWIRGIQAAVKQIVKESKSG